MKNEKYFYLEDGGVLKSVKEFGMKLDEIPNHVFKLHVNAQKNDFALWVEHVFKQKKLADELKTTTNKLESQVIVLKRLLAKKTTKSIKKFKCKKCDKAFTSKVGLSVHDTLAHKKR